MTKTKIKNQKRTLEILHRILLSGESLTGEQLRNGFFPRGAWPLRDMEHLHKFIRFAGVLKLTDAGREFLKSEWGIDQAEVDALGEYTADELLRDTLADLEEKPPRKRKRKDGGA